MKHMMIKVLSLVMALTMIMGMFGAVALSAAEHVHTKGDKVKTVAPTCVAYGYTLYECADCGETYADDILAKTEECQNIVDVKEVAATCTSNAISAGKKCADCGTYVEGGEEIPGTKLQHNMVIGITQPTCDVDGEVYEYCSLCNKEREQIMNLPALGNNGEHVTEYTITKAPSCGESGLATWGCTLCDKYTVEGIYVAPNPDLHEWEEVDDKPTCTSAGFKGWECTECWTTTTINPETGVELVGGGLIDAYNHKNDVTVITASNYEGYAYFINNNFKPADLSLKATCTEDGFHYVYCNDCEQILKITDKALKHTFENWYDEDTSTENASYIVERVAATCENAGYVVVKCDHYDGETCKETKTIIEAEALNKDHKHNWWSDLTTRYKGEIADGYKWNRIEATCTTAGYTIVTCTNKGCTETKKIDAVDAIGHNYEYRCAVCGDVECLNCTHDRKLVCVSTGDRLGCGAEKAVTKQDAHNMSKDKDVKTIPATCSQYAYDTYYCKNEGCEYIGDTLYQYAIKDANGNVVFDTEAGYDEDNHSDLKKMVITPATCITEGKAKFSCTNCNVGTWEEAIPVLVYDANGLKHADYRTEVAEKAANCQEKGYTAGIYCELCADLELGYSEILGDYGYIKGITATAKNPANHKVDETKVLFHRHGTCNIKELTVYQCEPCSTNEKNVEFEVVGDYDEYNHNKYVYVNNVLDASQSSTTITEAPAYVGEETHWGACIKYHKTFVTCLDDGYHANLTCTACKEVLATSEVGFVKYTDATVTEADSLVYVDAAVRDTTGRIADVTTITCPVCKAYADVNVDGDGNGTKGREESPHITYTYLENDDGSYVVDPTTKMPIIEYYEVQLLLPATGHDFEDVAAKDETCDEPGHTAGKNCVNQWPKDIAATKDKDTTNDDACGYKEGQAFIPAHGDGYVITYEAKAPTCISYGIGELATAFTYKNARHEKFVVIGALTDDYGAEVYAGQALVYADGVYTVVEAKALTKYTADQIVIDGTGIDTTMGDEPAINASYNFTLIDVNNEAAVAGKYCSKCEEKKDIADRAYYITPLAHDYVMETIANSCTDFGWTEFKCTKCTANGPHWTDRDGDNVVDVEIVRDGTGAIDYSVLELSWFITEFEYADGHNYPKYDKVSDVPDTGWLVLDQIVSDAELSMLKAAGYEKVLGALNACTTDRIKYVQCTNPGCSERKSMGDVIPATGHYKTETDGTKTYISWNCNEIDKWVGYTCDGCNQTIYKDSVPAHDLVHVYLSETCTREGLQNCWACVNCDKHFYVIEEAGAVEIVEIDFTPTEKEAAANGYDYALMCAIVDEIVVPKHTPVITGVDEYVPATETKDGYWVYTCRKCGETVKKVLRADAKLVLDITVEDVNGAKVTANGNEIVFKVAYTAKEYKFRALNLDFWFDNYSLTFNKAEIKAEYDTTLNVITDVAVDDGEINVLTYVPNGLKQNATLTGEDTAFIYFYFTVNKADTTIDVDDFRIYDAEAKFYDAKTGANVDQSQYVSWNSDYELEVYATGDVDGGYEIDYSDLLDMMDIIYTTDAKYNAMADINKDGVIDVEDFAALKTFVGTKQTALDYAEMMGVELPDYETLALQVLNIEKLDVNGDDKINKADLDALCNSSVPLASILDTLVNDLDSYGSWYVFFMADIANATEAELVDDLTDLIVDIYEEIIA